jgi:SAM-dependent methyltransferase
MRRNDELRLLTERVEELTAQLSAAEEGSAMQAGRLVEFEEWLRGITARVEEAGGLAESYRDTIAALTRDQMATSSQLLALVSSDSDDERPRLIPGAGTIVGGSNLEPFDAGLGGTVLGFRGAARVDREQVYLEFENAFRGSEEMILQRQRAYLPLLEGHGPVLDVGCGRGELLQLLKGAGVSAQGIDTDEGMIQRCREKGLDEVQVADAVEFLREAPRGSLGSIVALQVIEHLPYAVLLAFIDESLAVLRPGGRLIVETVNPHSPGALRAFWTDPTHQHPLYPEVVLSLCRLAGFDSGYIWHAQGTGDPVRDRAEQPDYTVVGEVLAS